MRNDGYCPFLYSFVNGKIVGHTTFYWWSFSQRLVIFYFLKVEIMILISWTSKSCPRWICCVIYYIIWLIIYMADKVLLVICPNIVMGWSHLPTKFRVINLVGSNHWNRLHIPFNYILRNIVVVTAVRVRVTKVYTDSCSLTMDYHHLTFIDNYLSSLLSF